MEEDLKDIELFIYFCRAPYNFEHESEEKSYKELSDKIEQLIKTYKDLKEIEESHRKENGELRKRVKELEEENERLKGKIDVCNWQEKSCRDIIDENYIPIYLVKEMIEELEKKMEYANNEKVLIWLHKQRKVLRELLEKRK